MVFSSVAFFFLVPSPRWLTLQGSPHEASAAWDKLEIDEQDREKTPVDGENGPENPTSQEDTSNIQSSNSEGKCPNRSKGKFFELFSADIRARTFLGVFVMGMQQLSGIDGVLYVSILPHIALSSLNLLQYAPLIFQQAGISSSESSFLASGVSAIVILAATIPATIFADKWGRRSSLITGGVSMGTVMLVIGALYAANTVKPASGAARWVVIIAIYIYVVLYCISWSVSCKVYAAEVQPQRTRASATNLAHGANWVTNFLVALTTPVLLSRSNSGAYFLWAGCLVLTALVCFVALPETKGRNLDEIESAFLKETVWRTAERKIESAVGALKRR